MNLKKFFIMKFNLTIAAVGLAVALISCEKEEADSNVFVPNTPDTTVVSGTNMSFKINGAASFSYLSKGFGALCPTVGQPGSFTWMLATGNNLQYDPATQEFLPDMNDTTFAVAWLANYSTVGTYTIPNPLSEAECFMIAPTFIRFYDPSQIQIDVTGITTDSIFGTYHGALPELIDLQIDTVTGNLVPTYSGVVDSVATTFRVQRNPC